MATHNVLGCTISDTILINSNSTNTCTVLGNREVCRPAQLLMCRRQASQLALLVLIHLLRFYLSEGSSKQLPVFLLCNFFTSFLTMFTLLFTIFYILHFQQPTRSVKEYKYVYDSYICGFKLQ